MKPARKNLRDKRDVPLAAKRRLDSCEIDDGVDAYRNAYDEPSPWCRCDWCGPFEDVEPLEPAPRLTFGDVLMFGATPNIRRGASNSSNQGSNTPAARPQGHQEAR